MKTKACTVLLLFAFAILLSGCGKLLVTTTILPDGSGTNEVIFALDTYQVQPGNIFWTSVNINRRALEKEGAHVDSWQDGSFQGFRATFDFDNLSEMERQLTAEDIGGDYEYGDSSLRVIFSDVRAWFDEYDNAHFIAQGDRTGAIETGSENSFTLRMPGNIISYTEQAAAERINSNTVVWDLTDFNNRAFELKVVSEISRFPLITVLAVAAVILIVVVAIVVIKSVRKSPISNMHSFESSTVSPSLRKTLKRKRHGIFTWSWIIGGVVGIIAFVQGIFVQCTWLISPFGGVQFMGCSFTTGPTIYISYIAISYCGAGIAGFIGSNISGSLKSGAKSGALALGLPSIAEGIASLVNASDSSVNMLPLSCISVPISVAIGAIFGAFLGVLGGWVGREILKWRKRDDPPFIADLNISKEIIFPGDKMVISAEVGNPRRASGLRLYFDNHLLKETNRNKCSFEIDTSSLSTGEYTIRVETSDINDPNWENPVSNEKMFYCRSHTP